MCLIRYNICYLVQNLMYRLMISLNYVIYICLLYFLFTLGLRYLYLRELHYSNANSIESDEIIKGTIPLTFANILGNGIPAFIPCPYVFHVGYTDKISPWWRNGTA